MSAVAIETTCFAGGEPEYDFPFDVGLVLAAGFTPVVEAKVIGIDRSTTFAFTDGLSSGELQGMSEALGATWTSKFKDAETLPLGLIASRLPDEEAFFARMNAKVWAMVQKVTITNDQQLELLPKVEIEQQEASKVAADWIAANEAVWSTWFS